MQRAEARPLPRPIWVKRCDMLDALPRLRSSWIIEVGSFSALKTARATRLGGCCQVYSAWTRALTSKRQQSLFLGPIAAASSSRVQSHIIAVLHCCPAVLSCSAVLLCSPAVLFCSSRVLQCSASPTSPKYPKGLLTLDGVDRHDSALASGSEARLIADVIFSCALRVTYYGGTFVLAGAAVAGLRISAGWGGATCDRKGKRVRVPGPAARRRCDALHCMLCSAPAPKKVSP